MYLFGAGGHAKVIIDILNDNGISIAGLFDDNSENKLGGAAIFLGKYINQPLDAPLIISIGNNNIRANIARNLNLTFGTAIHSSAIVSPSAIINPGCVVMQGAVIQASAVIGNHVIVNTGACVDHDCSIESFAHIAPGAILCGNVQVGEGTLIGAGSIVPPNIKIGKWCKIGAGSIVTKDIPDYSTAYGNPVQLRN